MTVRLFSSSHDITPYERVIHICLLLATFAVPFFFLPATTESLAINKAALFYVLVLIAGVTWLLHLVLGKGDTVRRSGADVPLALFVVFSILATIFSLYPFRSLAGTGGYVSDSLVATLMFVMFFFVFLNTVRREQLRWYMSTLLLSGVVLAIFNTFQVFGVYILPWEVTQAINFNAIANSSLALSIYLAALLLCSLLVFLRHYAVDDPPKAHPVVRWGTLVLSILCFFLLLTYDQPFGWYLVILGLVIILLFTNARGSQQHRAAWLVVPTVLIGVSFVALFLNTQAMLGASIPSDIQLPARFGWDVAVDTAVDYPIFGAGQGTFQAVFEGARPDTFNESSLWSLRFLKSSNEVFQIAAGIGVVGTLAFLVMIVLMLRKTIAGLIRVTMRDDWWLYLGITLIVLLSVVSLLFVPFGFSLWFLLWLALAMSVIAFTNDAAVKKTRPKRTTTSFGASIGFSLVLVLGIVFVYFAGRIWYADVLVARANRSLATQEDINSIRELYARSIDLNGYEQAPYFQLAQNLLVQSQLAAQAENADPNQVAVLLGGSIASARSGANLYPAHADSWAAFAQLLHDVDVFSGVPQDETIASFRRAIDIEPNNPQHHMNVGQYYLALARLQTDQAVAQADEDGVPDENLTAEATDALVNARMSFEEAVRLRPSYVEAKLNIALVMRLQGDGEGAITYLEQVVQENPLNVDALFNLSEHYLIDDRMDDALAVLERIREIYPGYSDARYRLAQLYLERDEIEQAIAELEVVAELNPDNADVQQQLQELRGDTTSEESGG